MIEYRKYGPPGTGKTTWIAKRSAQSARRFGDDMISVCSLTNAAVREAAGRELEVDPDNVTTLHARCKRALHAPAPAESKVNEFAAAYPVTAKDFPRSILDLSTRHKSSDDGGDSWEGLSNLLLSAGSQESSHYERSNVLRQQMITPSPDTWGADTYQWWMRWSNWCKESGYLDFTGWLETALEVKPLPRQKVVYVDEGQDHTPLQFAVLRSWNTDFLIVTGDDDQTLYEWSGASPEAFFNPALPAGQEDVLRQSYRVPREIHKLSMEWIKGVSNRRSKEYFPRDANGRVIRDSYSLRDSQQGRLPSSLLQDPDRTHMFLATCGYMLNHLIDSLRSQGIPFHNPYRSSHHGWNPLGSAWLRIQTYLKPGLWTGTEMVYWANQLKTIDVFRPNQRDIAIKRWTKLEDRRVTTDDLSQAFTPGVLHMMMQRDLDVLEKMRKVGSLGSWEYGLKVARRGEADQKPRVIVGTVHSVKGGQADDVWLFPDLSRAGTNDWFSPHRDSLMRLAYVGMTRARDNLYLCSPSGSAIQW